MPHIQNLLLDRDGTVIVDKHYLADPAGVELLPGVAESLGLLAGRGVRFFLVSNQSGVGRGYFSAEAVLACNERLGELLRPYGVRFSDSLFCPHIPEELCACRKPGIGMWLELQRRHGLEAAASLMIGDKPEDMALAASAGLGGSILVLSGKGRDSAKKLGLFPEAAGQNAVTPEAKRVYGSAPLYFVTRKKGEDARPDMLLEDFYSLPAAVDFFENRPLPG